MSSTYNISATQGSTLLLNLTARDADSNLINLSGYGARGYVRYSYGSSGILFDLNPIIPQSTVASGIVTISGNATGLAVLPVGNFKYDVEIFNSGGYVTKFLNGNFEVNGEITY